MQVRIFLGADFADAADYNLPCGCKSNYHSPSKLEGVPEGGGRMSVNACFYTIIMLAFFTDSSGLKATSPNLGEEL